MRRDQVLVIFCTGLAYACLAVAALPVLVTPFARNGLVSIGISGSAGLVGIDFDGGHRGYCIELGRCREGVVIGNGSRQGGSMQRVANIKVVADIGGLHAVGNRRANQHAEDHQNCKQVFHSEIKKGERFTAIKRLESYVVVECKQCHIPNPVRSRYGQLHLHTTIERCWPHHREFSGAMLDESRTICKHTFGW